MNISPMGMKEDNSPLNLTILPSLRAKILPNGDVSLTEKFLDGTLKYQSLWSGSLTVLIEGDSQKDSFSVEKEVIYQADKFPFKLEVVSFDNLNPDKLKNESSVVLASVGYNQNHISQVCNLARIPCIYVSEYSIKTRKQIVAATTNNPLVRFRRNLWQDSQERKQRKALALAQGIQCNGTPTYEAYREINPNPLLYFDTRITEDMLATEEEIVKRYSSIQGNTPLRLAFSGRLVKIKGADHLVDVAQELKRLGINFKFFICGDGDLKEKMQQQIVEKQLDDCVQLMGKLDFKTELVPFIKANIDLFICCHRQGDPSCTYLETMSCGVPIVGYNNEAFEGLNTYSKTGWVVDMDQPKLVAQKIAQLYQRRDEIKEMSLKSLQFAKLHTFNKTFESRVAHIQHIATNYGRSL